MRARLSSALIGTTLSLLALPLLAMPPATSAPPAPPASHPRAGDSCQDPKGVAVDSDGHTLHCNPAGSGHALLWQLQP
ncbi:MAG: hypothetical protein J2P18_01465 [Nocardia sp.]|nr:hypothetical protein [Nocardia sp.]